MANIENLIGSQIQSVYSEKFSTETTGYVGVIIQVSEVYMQLTVDDRTDEIDIKISHQVDLNKFSKPLWAKAIVGKTIMQIWGMENEKGYSDLICLGLDEVIPTIVFSVMASEIKFGLVHYIDRNQEFSK